jgi:hypothetical protein
MPGHDGVAFARRLVIHWLRDGRGQQLRQRVAGDIATRDASEDLLGVLASDGGVPVSSHLAP